MNYLGTAGKGHVPSPPKANVVVAATWAWGAATTPETPPAPPAHLTKRRESAIAVPRPAAGAFAEEKQTAKKQIAGKQGTGKQAAGKQAAGKHVAATVPAKPVPGLAD